MEMETQEKYNGWKNYETWLLHLNLSNEQGLYEMVFEWVKDNPKENFEYQFERDETFKDWLYEMFFIEEYNVIKICDSWTTRDFDDVDFREVLEAFEEE